ncbi:FUSC family protein [Neorhizobium lilium]|uniref:FUSC family protein n=1 Tax=Neorhizobium lilium TaxID=2503024 RepID=A0A3S3VFV4_9HYPH|nr:FUSC family protein [Neorhizobium lilium]RWX75657.1 FUSC family protein [Neorhizobium lilium]
MTRRLALPDWLLAHDPALSRARMGGRVTLTILVSVGLLILFHLLVAALPPIAYGLTIILSIESGVAVRDLSQRDQTKTRLLGCVASLLCVAVAAVLEDHRVVSDLVFLLVIFCASLARVFGPRGFAIGMFAFTSYFIGAYLHPSPAELPFAALGPVVAVAVGYAVRKWIFFDDRRRDALQALVAVQARTDDILARLELLAVAGEWTEKDRTGLHRLEERLKDVVLMADSFLPMAAEEDANNRREDSGLAAVAMRLFDLHLAAESLIVLSLESLPPVGLIEAVLNGDGDRVRHFSARADQETSKAKLPAGESVRALMWLHGAREALAADIGRIDHGDLDMAGGDRPATPSATLDLSLKNPAVRAALQITIASAIAMVFGLLLSRERWFWSVLTAFLVFTNTKSRGDTAIRAVQRSTGTLLGVVIGLGIATLLVGNMVATVVLASMTVFLAFYFLQVSYAVMSFFITITLCLVYGLIGQLTVDLLFLRLEETLIGALAGTFAAFVVLPASTRAVLDEALARWYDGLRQLLDAADEGRGRLELIELSRKLDAAYKDLTLAAKPLGASWSVVTRPGQIRQTLAIFMASTYWARIFANTTASISADNAVTEAISSARQALEAVAPRGSDCFLQRRDERRTGSRYLPISEDGSRLGLVMIGNLLDRLYPRT